jgi:hypothetical protein
MNLSLPTADEEGVRRIQDLYKQKFGVESTHAEAKAMLEGAMRLVYLTEVEHAIHPIREEIERQRRQAGEEY